MGDPGADAPEQFFDQEQLDALRQRQIDAVAYLDENVFPRLFEKLPADTWLVVTADHGELFGEEGFFGHGPVQHPKVTEVPFVEGLAP
jgi:arylsulfatase A-like enzyme